MVEVYSDGSSHARRGLAGGWCFIVVKDGQPVAIRYGGDPCTSNNRMEIQAAIEGLRYVERRAQAFLDESIFLVSDSKVTLGLASGIFSPSKNIEIATELRNLAVSTGAKTRWVPGHTGDRWNEVCDRLAKRGKLENSGGQNG